MIALYDHIISLMVAGIIILLLFNVQQDAQQTSIERDIMYMAKTRTLDFASVLERDLINAGYGTSPVEDGILVHNTNGAGVTDTLLFWSMGASGEPARIAYSVKQQNTAVLDGDTLAIYQLKRYERRGAVYVEAGGSTPTLTQFRIDLLTAGNTPTGPSTAKRLRVRFANAVMPTLEDDRYLEGYRQLYWGVTLTPPSLD